MFKWFQVLLCITNNSICFYTVSLSNGSIWPVDRTLSGTTTPGLTAPGSDGNEEVLRIPQAPALLEPHHQIV